MNRFTEEPDEANIVGMLNGTFIVCSKSRCRRNTHLY